MKNKKNKRKGLIIFLLFIPLAICYTLSEMDDIFKTGAYVFLCAILGVILSIIFDKIKSKVKKFIDAFEVRLIKREYNVFYKNYGNEIEYELEEFKHKAKRLMRNLGGKSELLKYDGFEFLGCVHPTGIYIVNFDDTAEKVIGIADDKKLSTCDEKYYDFGCANNKNIAKLLEKEVKNALNLNDKEFCLTNFWTVHSSYCLYSVLTSGDGRFRHLNTKNFEDCVKEYFNNPVKVFSEIDIEGINDVLKETFIY